MDLLPALDNFGRAAQASSTAATTDSLQRGMDLIHRQLLEALRKHGVEEYSCAGTQFDPRRAEAISFVHTNQPEPGMVVSEISRGYACGDRVLRPARVVVAKAVELSQQADITGKDPRAAVATSQKADVLDQESESKEGEVEEPGRDSE